MRVLQHVGHLILCLVLLPAAIAAGNDVLEIRKVERPGETEPGKNLIHNRGLIPERNTTIDLGLERAKPWSLPKKALDPNFLDTVRCLVLRFNFQYETVDDPNTSGRGHMLINSPEADSAANPNYLGMAGAIGIDPPPHDSAYFDSHMQALSRYWEVVSDEKISLSWDIYPPGPDSVYELPHPMNHYGKCGFDSVIAGLERYFIDGIQLADTASPEIDFSQYDAIFLFHAGSDRQNDLGFPPTCNDLFTGFIMFGDSLGVDNDSNWVRTALLMPEATNQDNRATAMNAVLAHEFGHQLGLVDLYSTRTFMTQLGDFALMDNNGFGTNVDFGLEVGGVYGTVPLFPCAWSRAYLGFVDVHDFREGTDITLAAAQMLEDSIKVARVPISEKEYYLLENRIVEYDGIPTGQKIDSVTNVLQGPVQVFYEGGEPVSGDFTREYDVLIPGSGMLIYHVDESVAGMDYNLDGDNNFDDNHLQWDPDRKFITLIEGDGIVNFGGYYRAGWGSEEDMYRDDRNTSFTPNTNPPTIDNTGNNTRVRITNIARKILVDGGSAQRVDSLMTFDVETDGLVADFPVRVGASVLPLSPIAADLNRDGTDEIIVAAGRRVLALTTDGENYLRKFYGTATTPLFYDTAYASVHPGRAYPVPMFYAFGFDDAVWAGPVVGDFGESSGPLYVAAGVSRPGSSSQIFILRASDDNNDGLADFHTGAAVPSNPIAMTFGPNLYMLLANGTVMFKPTSATGGIGTFTTLGSFPLVEYHGICRAGDALILVGGDPAQTTWYAIESDGDYDSLVVDGNYRYGPALVDVDRDGMPEIVGLSGHDGVSRIGSGILISVDTVQSPPVLSIKTQEPTGDWFATTNPVIADINDDGYPDIVAGATDNRVGASDYVIAFDRFFTLLADFPMNLDDRVVAEMLSAPVVGEIERGGRPEIITSTSPGNIYAYGDQLAYGFPLSAGEIGVGSPLIVHDSLGGKMGYVGADGWFYLWHTDVDTTRNYWPMAGADPTGSFVFEDAVLGEPKQFAGGFDEKRFFNYPNPVTDGRTTIRYFLGREARSVDLTIYDLSGTEVAAMRGPTTGGVDNELEWSCGDITPGVYRCRIEVDFDGDVETAFTDIALLR